MEKKQVLEVICTDLDGCALEPKGNIEILVANVIRDVTGIIPIGPATGKNAYFCDGLAKGIGLINGWHFVIAESGGVFLPSSPNGRVFDNTDLAVFKGLISLDPDEHTCSLGHYKPELKDSILTMYPLQGNPPRMDLALCRQWAHEFRLIVKSNNLNLKVQDHPNAGIDVLSVVINKGLGIPKLCALYDDIKPKNILVIVDGINDLELADGTTAIAVANALPEVKDLVLRQGGYVSRLPCGRGLLDGLYHYACQEAFGEKSEEIIKIIRKNALEIAEKYNSLFSAI